MAVDLGRKTFNHAMQFDVAGEIIVPVRWYYCQDGAAWFPQPTLFTSPAFWGDGVELLGPGPYWGAKPVYNNGAAPFYAPGTGSFCGPLDWWRNGTPSNAPPIEYSAAGVPVCCPQPPCVPFCYLGGMLRYFMSTASGAVPWTLVTSTTEEYVVVNPSDANTSMHANWNPTHPCQGGAGLTTPYLLQNPGGHIREGVLVAYDQPSQVSTWIFPTATAPYNNQSFVLYTGSTPVPIP
jgi:hypothetical protein